MLSKLQNPARPFYVASPYSSRNPDKLAAAGERNMRYITVMEYSAWLANQRIWHFSPILHQHVTAQQYSLPTDAAFWWDYNRAMIDVSGGIILCKMWKWEESIGVKQELEYARDRGLLVVGLEKTQAQDFRFEELLPHVG